MACGRKICKKKKKKVVLGKMCSKLMLSGMNLHVGHYLLDMDAKEGKWE